MLQSAIDAEVEAFVEEYSDRRDDRGRRQVVKNGRLPEREVLTGAGAITVSQGRVCDNHPDPDRRVFINPRVCEGCGDCGVQSNCVSILPLETPLGRKRQIDQSSCNKDFSCLKGFCPSFVTLHGATPKKEAAASLDLPDLPDPVLPKIDGVWKAIGVNTRRR